MTTMTDDELYSAAHTMLEYGGSFAAAIAEAFFVSDSANRERLLTAFGHLFEQYKGDTQ